MYNRKPSPGFHADLFVDPALPFGPFALEKSLKLFLGDTKSEGPEFPAVLTAKSMST
jgi:hypothetical protein